MIQYQGGGGAVWKTRCLKGLDLSLHSATWFNLSMERLSLGLEYTYCLESPDNSSHGKDKGSLHIVCNTCPYLTAPMQSCYKFHSKFNCRFSSESGCWTYNMRAWLQHRYEARNQIPGRLMPWTLLPHFWVIFRQWEILLRFPSVLLSLQLGLLWSQSDTVNNIRYKYYYSYDN